MSVLGLSHIVLRAGNVEEYKDTISFYTLLGFKQTPNKDNSYNALDSVDENKTWLHLSTSLQSFAEDIKINLILGNTTIRQQKVSEDMDWALLECAVVLAVSNADSTLRLLQDSKVPYQDKTERTGKGRAEGVEIYALDPLGNVILFTNKPAFPHVLPLNDPIQGKLAHLLPSDSSSQPKRIGILTSGGDAPGMNPAVRAVVRYGISKGCEMYAIYEGYQGLVDGGKQIRKMNWKSVRGWLTVGGTNIGTARCMEFKTREGRLKAAENLIKHGIDALIVCGGDGSLTGADVFRAEWPSLLNDLTSQQRITKEEATTYCSLTIVGMVGSIDNDMSGTDITIGAITSLHRICESVDSIGTTAMSHSRAFVIEVMGRHCGWLALMAGIATGADFVFIPERPPVEDDWESVMCAVTQRHRELGKRKTVIIVAEGAIDKNLKPIKPDYIKDILTDRLGLDTRVTTLGHTQRGGSPAAFDRWLATIQGVAAVDAALRATPESPSPLIGMSNNHVTSRPLMKAVEMTNEVASAIGQKNFARAMELRDPQFAEEYDAFSASTILDNDSIKLPVHKRLRIAIIHVGAPAGGMNAATRTAVRFAINRGHRAFAIYNGFSGLVKGTVEELTWIDVDGWTSHGGSELGTNRHVPGEHVDMGMVAYQLQKFNIQGLMLVGGFEAFSALVNLEEARQKYPSLRIPISLIPATVSNNVPGTDFSLGCDTSLNSIIESCDAIVQSARSSRRRVFVVEVQGGRSGFLAVVGGLSSGACSIYIPEEGISLERLQSDVRHLMALYLDDDADMSEGRIVLRNEKASSTYTTDVISSILRDEGHALFDSRTAVLGHIQQGNTPSPMDRIRATYLANKCVHFIEDHTAEALDRAFTEKAHVPVVLSDCHESAAVVGLAGVTATITPVRDLLAETDFKNRRPKNAWWFEHRTLVSLLSGRGLFTPQAQHLLHQ